MKDTMELIRLIKLFTLSTIFFITLDCLFLGYLMNERYLHYLSPIARLNKGKLSPNLIAGVLVWILIVLGMFIFVLPHITRSSALTSFGWGALYGFILYGMYDLTNLSVLAHWPLPITLIDICWGTCANGLLATFIWVLTNYL